jgi:WD40 repeat protein
MKPTGNRLRESRITFCVVSLSLGGFAVGGSIAMAQSPGTFTATGEMITPRSQHTATLLTNGKVLIAGGTQGSHTLASVEIYDPSTGMFATTGSMTKARAQHSATLLPDGWVSVVGGSTDLSAEIYDPDTGTFSPTANPVARPFQSFRSSTALLKDGRVLIAAQPTARIYDPVTGTFVATGRYFGPIPPWIKSATLLPDARVLRIGEDAQVYLPRQRDLRSWGYMNYCYDVLTATPDCGGRQGE